MAHPGNFIYIGISLIAVKRECQYCPQSVVAATYRELPVYANTVLGV